MTVAHEPDGSDEWVDDGVDPEELELDCDHCGEVLMEGYRIDEHDWQFWCSKACMAADGHDPTNAYATVTELGLDDNGGEL